MTCDGSRVTRGGSDRLPLLAVLPLAGERMSRAIGTPCETATVKYLVDHGFPYAERRALHGSVDLGDIVGTPGVCWEVKGGKAAETASDGQVAKWLEETEEERVNAHADFGVLVMKRKGIGHGRAGEWWAVMPLRELVNLIEGHPDPGAINWTIPVRIRLHEMARLLRQAGYGEPL